MTAAPQPPPDDAHPHRGPTRDPASIARLRAQYRTARAQGDALARFFYQELFTQHPATRALFKQDLDSQRANLLDSLDAVMEYLDRPSQQEAYLRELGARHVDYGVRPHHYAIVATLLADAIVRVLGDEADQHAREDWNALFRAVTDLMLDGSR
jgi:nitric oxide dioxygenase